MLFSSHAFSAHFQLSHSDPTPPRFCCLVQFTLAEDILEIASVAIPLMDCSSRRQLVSIYPTLSKSNLIGRSHLWSLTLCECAHKIAGVQQARIGPGIEPSKAAPHCFNVEGSLGSVDFQKIRNPAPPWAWGKWFKNSMTAVERCIE